LPSTLLEGASAGESCYAVVWQTWLCHHFFPTQFPPLQAYHLDNPGSRGIKEICRPYTHHPDFGWQIEPSFLYRWGTDLSVQYCSPEWSKALIPIKFLCGPSIVALALHKTEMSNIDQGCEQY